MTKVLATKEITGTDALKELKSTIKNIRGQGLRIPAITYRGKGTFQGFDVEVLEDKPVHLPIGHRLIKVVTEEGLAAKSLKPDEDAVVTVYSVAEGDVLKANDPLADYDMFTPEDVTSEGDEDEDEDDE